MNANKILLRFGGITGMLFLLSNLSAQEVKINSGSNCKVTGGANVILINADVKNDGSFTSTGNSTVKFKGDSAQVLGGSSSITFENLSLDNAQGLILNNSETVNGTLTFTNGKITLGNNDLIMGPAASINGSSSLNYMVTDGTGSLRQHVMNNATDVTYPVGLADEYLPVTIQLTIGSTADDISARVVNGLYTAYGEGNVPAGSLIDDHSVSKTWILEEQQDGGTQATVNVQWNAQDETMGFDRNLSNIGKYSGNSWNYSSPGFAMGTGPYTQQIDNITEFSPLGVFSPSILYSLGQASFCAGDPVPVVYTASGALWSSGNTFTAQLSDASGDFTSPTDIGSLTSTSSGTVEANIPSSSTDGSHYRIRITSDMPGFTAEDNGEDLSIAQLRSISGDITYYNLANTPLTSGINVKLYQDGLQVGADFPVTDGTFTFNDLCPGEYELRITSNRSTAGSVNTTDAAQVHFWGANPYTIEKVRFYAGDVAGETFFLNSSDAQLLKAHFVYGTPFQKGEPWTFWAAGQTISSNTNPQESYPIVSLIAGSNATADIYGLCTGDFNRSFSAQQKSSPALILINNATMEIGNNTEIEVPVKIINESVIGAMSISLEFPASLIEITDVTLSNSGLPVDWTINENELRIGWFSQNPVLLGENDALLTMKVKPLPGFNTGNQAIFQLNPAIASELADEKYEVIGDAIISIPIIEALAYDITESYPGNIAGFDAYPNPFDDHLSFRYSLREAGNVTLEIVNMLGEYQMIVVDKYQSAGDFILKVNTSGLNPGIYIATIRQITKTNANAKSLKLIK